MKIKLAITYRFKTVDIEPVSKEQIEILEEHATEKIFEYMSNGFTSGELACNITDDYTVYGWFEVSKTNEN